MSTRNRIAGLALLTALGIGWAPSARATSITPVSIEEMTDLSDYVVRGVITEVWTEADERGRIWTRAQLEISQSYKGEAPEGLILSQLGGVHHNDYSVMPSAARFSPGEEGLFFLETSRSGRVRTIGMFQGKFTVRIDPDNGQEILVRFTVPQDMVYDHRFIPTPPPEDRVYADDIVQRVLDEVALSNAQGEE